LTVFEPNNFYKKGKSGWLIVIQKERHRSRTDLLQICAWKRPFIKCKKVRGKAKSISVILNSQNNNLFMKRKSVATSTLLVWLLAMTTVEQTAAQAKYDKMFNKAEAAYELGDYKGAESALEKANSKAAKKLGKQNKYVTNYYLSKAKIALASGLLFDFESLVNETVKQSVAINSEKSQPHGLVLLSIAELYVQNGSHKTAVEYLNQSNQILKAGKFLDEGTAARLDLTRAEALTGQGYFIEAVETLLSREKYFAGKAVKQEAYADEKGGLKTRRLSDDEITKRYNDYARWMTALANNYRLKGNLISADSAFVGAGTWIERNLGRSVIAYVKNQILFSNLLIENGLRPDKSFPEHSGYERALDNIKSKHKASHYLGAEIYEQHLKRLLTQDNTSKFLSTQSEFERMIKDSYKKGSVYSVRQQAVEFDIRMDKDRVRNLESKANNLLASNKNLPRNNRTTVNVNEFLYALSLNQKNYKSAEAYLKTIIEIKEELLGKDVPETHLARLQLANFYLDYTNKIQEALKIYNDSYLGVVSKQIGPWHFQHLDILNHLALVYELTDKYDKAAESLEKASEVARSKYQDNDPLYGIQLTKSANLRLKLGQYEKAEADLKLALKILEEHRKNDAWKHALVLAIETEAKLFGLKGLFSEAEDNLDRSAKIISRADTDLNIDELTTAQELSSLLIQLGRYSDTEPILDALIIEYQRLYGGQSLRLLEPLVNRGNLLLAKGDYTEADKVAQRSYQIALPIYGDNSTKTAPAQKLLADLYYILGDYPRAEEFIMKTLQSQQKQFGLEHIEVAKSLAQLALIRFANGEDPKEIEGLLTEARDIIGKRLGKENPQYAEVLKSVAILYISTKKFDLAFNSLTQAENIWRTKTGSKNNIKAASIYALTGDVYYQLKNYNKAEEFYNKSKDIYEKNFSRNHPEYVRILSKLGKVFYMRKEFKKAKRNIEEALSNYESYIKQFFPALSEREKAKYWNTIKGDFEFYNTLAFGQLEDFRDLSGKVYNYQLLTKALLLNSSIKIRERILASKDDALISSYNLWVKKKETLTSALSMSTAQLQGNGIDPNALNAEVEKLEKEISEKSEDFGTGFENKKITYENVQKSLGKNEVAVEMLRFRYFNHTFTDSIIYVALYVKSDNARPKVIELPDGHHMESRFFKYYRNCIINQVPDQASYKVFWEPFQKEVGQYSTIYISPDGVYNQINLEAIPTPDGRFVIDNSNIVTVSNTKDLYLKKVKLKSKPSANNASMFGNPFFYASATKDKSIPQLPGTEKEIKELDELLTQKGWKTTGYTEMEASEEKVKELNSPKIFHIATHGFYSPTIDKSEIEALSESESQLAENPLMKSGLLLSGAGDILAKTRFNYNMESGVLTAHEAMNLSLDQTDLVVLSACETGLGEISNGEGVYGLQRAFLVAGAKVLIMSMFKVDDAATQKLILNFYRKWTNSGNLRLSFVEAKKELRVEYPEPIYWGAFMMIGLE
jgi:CHAT domain-containing protein